MGIDFGEISAPLPGYLGDPIALACGVGIYVPIKTTSPPG